MNKPWGFPSVGSVRSKERDGDRATLVEMRPVQQKTLLIFKICLKFTFSHYYDIIYKRRMNKKSHNS